MSLAVRKAIVAKYISIGIGLPFYIDIFECNVCEEKFPYKSRLIYYCKPCGEAVNEVKTYRNTEAMREKRLKAKEVINDE